ncbi:hypothetical protein LINGRAHAP2_LOCUS1774 [Linum grandiflorum]
MAESHFSPFQRIDSLNGQDLTSASYSILRLEEIEGSEKKLGFEKLWDSSSTAEKSTSTSSCLQSGKIDKDLLSF